MAKTPITYWEVSTSDVTGETKYGVGRNGPRLYVQGSEEDAALVTRLLNLFEDFEDEDKWTA